MLDPGGKGTARADVYHQMVQAYEADGAGNGGDRRQKRAGIRRGTAMLAMDEPWPKKQPKDGDITSGNGVCHPARRLHYPRRVVHPAYFAAASLRDAEKLPMASPPKSAEPLIEVSAIVPM